MSDRLIIAVIASGVPLVIWWLLQQRIRQPWQGRPSENPRPGWLRRHGLSVEEADEVAGAVLSGKELPDGRLRAAATEWAGFLLRTGRPHDPRLRRILTGLLVGWLLMVVALMVWSVATGHADASNWFFVLVWVGLAVSMAARRRQVRRSLELNSASPGQRS